MAVVEAMTSLPTTVDCAPKAAIFAPIAKDSTAGAQAILFSFAIAIPAPSAPDPADVRVQFAKVDPPPAS